MKYIKKSQIFILVLICLVFVLSLTLALTNNKGIRYTFIFPSADNDQLVIENRYLPYHYENVISLYVDELLLGAVTERTKNILPKGTRVNSCFLRNGTLYLDLSSEFLNVSAGDYALKDGVELLEKNIRNNFSSVKKLELFVNSKKAYETLK